MENFKNTTKLTMFSTRGIMFYQVIYFLLENKLICYKKEDVPHSWCILDNLRVEKIKQ